jgi:hypothetical protein
MGESEISVGGAVEIVQRIGNLFAHGSLQNTGEMMQKIAKVTNSKENGDFSDLGGLSSGELKFLSDNSKNFPAEYRAQIKLAMGIALSPDENMAYQQYREQKDIAAAQNGDLNQMTSGIMLGPVLGLGMSSGKNPNQGQTKNIIDNFTTDSKDVTEAKIAALKDAGYDVSGIKMQVKILRDQLNGVSSANDLYSMAGLDAAGIAQNKANPAIQNQAGDILQASGISNTQENRDKFIDTWCYAAAQWTLLKSSNFDPGSFASFMSNNINVGNYTLNEGVKKPWDVANQYKNANGDSADYKVVDQKGIGLNQGLENVLAFMNSNGVDSAQLSFIRNNDPTALHSIVINRQPDGSIRTVDSGWYTTNGQIMFKSNGSLNTDTSTMRHKKVILYMTYIFNDT